MAKTLTTTTQVNFVLIPSEAGMRQHKLTSIVVNKIFAIIPYHHSHFLVSPFDFTTFYTGHFKQGHTLFYSQAVFEYITIVNLNHLIVGTTAYVPDTRSVNGSLVKSSPPMVAVQVIVPASSAVKL